MSAKVFKITTLRDSTKKYLLSGYSYDPTNPDVIAFNQDRNLWNNVPYDERQWLESFMQLRTPRRIFTEAQFSNAAIIDQLFSDFPELVKKDRAVIVAYNDLKNMRSASERFNYFRYFKDHYITERIKKTRLYLPPRYLQKNDADNISDSEQNFLMWYSDYNLGQANKTDNSISSILKILSIPAAAIPGVGAVLSTGLFGVGSYLSAETNTGNNLYMPDFSQQQAGFSSNSLTTIILIGAATFFLFGKKRKRK